jgi:hypothetical protein
MPEPRRNEKEEEKRREKDEEKGRGQGWDEKWEHDRLRMISIAAIFIWGGLVALAGTLNLFNYDWGDMVGQFSFWVPGSSLLAKLLSVRLSPNTDVQLAVA